MSQGDIETATIFTRAMRKIQGRFTGIESNTTAEIGQAVNDHVALPDPHTQYLKESEYEAHRSREDLLKQATLSLDFANNKYEVYEGVVDGMTQMPFNDALDFTRASSATAQTATGKIKEVLTDEQRLVGNREGLLIEESRTNILPESEDFSTWEANSVSVTDEGGFFSILSDASGSLNRIQSPIVSVTSGLQYTYSVEVKKGTNDFITVTLQGQNFGASTNTTFDLANGTVTQQGVDADDSGVEALGDGYYLCYVVATANNTGSTQKSDVRLVDSEGGSSSVGTESIFIRHAQVEAGSRPSSRIVTSGTQVTRAADNCSRMLGDEFNAGEFTLYCEGQQLGDTSNFANSTFISLGGASNGSITFVARNDAVRFLTYNTTGGANSGYMFANMGGNNVHKMAVSWKTGNTFYGVSVNGIYIEVPLNGQIDPDILVRITVSNIFASNVGSTSNQTSSALSREIKAFPTALSEAELITLTGGT
jgi:hypothetical protein